MTTKKFAYKEMTLSTAQIEVPRETYQRKFNARRALKIAADFDERIANEPKVSYRDGKSLTVSTPSPPASCLTTEKIFRSSARCTSI